MSQPNPVVDPYFAKAKRWNDELVKLRSILLECDLVEELKWAKPSSFRNWERRWANW